MTKKLFLYVITAVFFTSFSLFSQDATTTQQSNSGNDLLKVLDESKKEAKEIQNTQNVKPVETSDNAVPAEGLVQKEPEAKAEPPKEVAKGTAPVAKEENAPLKPHVGTDSPKLISSAIYGQTGLFRVYSAQRQKSGPGSLGLSMHGEWFNQKNFITVGDEVSRFAWTGAMTWAPLSFTEIFASISGFTNTGKSTTVLQRMGDLRTGIKLGVDLSRVISVGTNFQAEILNGVGDLNIASNAYSYDMRALLTLDFMKAREIPIRLHFNAGYRFDGTSGPAGTATINRTQQFFLNVLPKDQITFGIGFEIPIEVMTLFVEYTSEQIWSLDYGDSPQRLTAGIKIFPTKAQDLSFDFGTDVRIMNSNQTTRAIGIPAYNLIFGMTLARLPHKETKEAPVVESKTAGGTLSGTVIDSETQGVIAGATINIDDGAANPMLSKEGTGAYSTCELPAGAHKITVTKDGYEPLTVTPVVVAGTSSPFDFAMTKKKVEKGALIFQIYNADDKPLAGTVTFLDYPNLKPYLVDSVNGGLKVRLKAGDYKVRIAADKYESEEKVVTVEAGKDLPYKTRLREIISKVEIKKDKIVIKDTIHFATNKAEILTESLSLLNRVADVIDDHKEIKKIRIEGHTDATGNDDLNMKLSQARADAVREYLLVRGISADRLESAGYGKTKPIASNATKQGRAMNRRVEFIIVNDEEAQPKAEPAKTAPAAKAESSGAEPAKTEPAKTEPAGTEPAKTDK